jgi:hypothetical protein
MIAEDIRIVIDRVMERMNESSIDFPQGDLPEDIWDKEEDGSYRVRKDVEKTIRKALDQYPKVKLQDIAKEIHLVGSMGTNQWQDDSDLDVHIIPDLGKIDDAEALQKDIKKFYMDSDNMIGKHKLEVYLQLNPMQEYVGDALYDLNTHEWKKGPTKVGRDFNPYEEYSEIIDTIGSVVGDTDKTLGSLKRKVIDYDVIKGAIKNMPKETKEKLKQALEAKEQEIENDIEKLMADKKEWIQRRKESSVPTTPEQALDDIEYVKKWKDENATFKFLHRYQYLRLINDMELMMKEDGGIDDDDVKDLKKMLGVKNTKGADDV